MAHGGPFGWELVDNRQIEQAVARDLVIAMFPTETATAESSAGSAAPFEATFLGASRTAGFKFGLVFLRDC